MKIKEFIGAVLIIGGFIGMIACVIAATVFYFNNPDMTGLRRLIECPEPTIGCIVCWICEVIGRNMIGSRKRY